ncbi:glycosyltransferase family 2 protein [Pseudomonas schmalbachii]|uniref:Glycosyltransferase family 2 protein n=1 Tax=Pseudomonas schmalbachii TaxID=2816993 RepID=A0ABS3TLP9_9PSED|nr:glycosyltransferase family A protein [Pseudomonas schmalbachii]MBO3274582.1 glycosyltransferase family 2 protein [Pseudomonas schmalbachii]
MIDWREGIARFGIFARPVLRLCFGELGRALQHKCLGTSLPVGALVREPCHARPWEFSRPLLSVVIPCFNDGQYLLEALRSLQHQTFQDFEVFLVDDGSEHPGTLRLLALIERLTRVELIRQSNKGPGAARNAGVARARGRYICCLDSDDRLAPDYLEKCVVLLEADAGTRLAYSWLQLFGEESRLFRARDLDFGLLRYVNHLGCSAVFHRDDWCAARGYSEARECLYEDWDFWIRLACLGVHGRVIEEPLFHYRRHGRTRLHGANQSAWKSRGVLRRAHRRFFADDAWRQNLMACRTLRPTVDPMLNLSRPEQYRQWPGGIVLVHLREGEDAARCWQFASCAGDASLQLIVEHDGPLPRWLVQRAEVIYRLPAFLDRSQWREFVDNFHRTRNIICSLPESGEGTDAAA